MSYPQTADNATIFDVVSWFARMGYHWSEVCFIKDFAQRCCNKYERCTLEAKLTYSTYPHELNDVCAEHIIHHSQLPPIPVGIHLAHGEQEDIGMDDAQSGEGENPPMATTVAR